MKIGQVLKDFLNELSKQSWRSVKDSNDFVIEATVDPRNARAIAILIRGGLDNLTDRYKYIVFNHENIIYLKFSFVGENQNEKPIPANFFKDLEIAISNFVKQFSSGWKELNISIDAFRKEFSGYKRFFKKYGDELVMFEHPSAFESNILLYRLENEDEDEPDHVCITHSFKANRDIIFGKKECVEKFIRNIAGELNPSYYYLTPEKEKPSVPSLIDQCVKAISRYSLFHAELSLAELAKLPVDNLEEPLFNAIIEYPMEHIQKWDDMDKYKDKIVIYKRHYQDKDNYSIYPERKELSVGMVSWMFFPWEGVGNGYNLDSLKKEKSHSNDALVTSCIKYANFKVRLPLPEELIKIKEAISNKKAFFDHDIDKILQKIDLQMVESEKFVAEEKAKIYCVAL